MISKKNLNCFGTGSFSSSFPFSQFSLRIPTRTKFQIDQASIEQPSLAHWHRKSRGLTPTRFNAYISLGIHTKQAYSSEIWRETTNHSRWTKLRKRLARAKGIKGVILFVSSRKTLIFVKNKVFNDRVMTEKTRFQKMFKGVLRIS